MKELSVEEKAKRFDEVLGKRYVCKSLLSFLNTLEMKEVQEEPVSEDLKEEIKRYQQEIYDRDTTVKDIARHFAKWGKKQAEIEIQAQSIAFAHGCPKE